MRERDFSSQTLRNSWQNIFLSLTAQKSFKKMNVMSFCWFYSKLVHLKFNILPKGLNKLHGCPHKIMKLWATFNRTMTKMWNIFMTFQLWWAIHFPQLSSTFTDRLSVTVLHCSVHNLRTLERERTILTNSGIENMV